MSDVFYLRPVDPPVAPTDLDAMIRYASGCFDLHRVEWRHSFLAADGRRMLCWYRAPDAESARLALRQLGSDMTSVWAGTILNASGPPLSEAALLAEFRFAEPGRTDAVSATLNGSAAAGRHGATFVRGFVSTCGTRMACVFGPQDEARLRQALDDAGLPAESVWACVPLAPKDLTA